MITLKNLKDLVKADTKLNNDQRITCHYTFDKVTNRLKMEYYDKHFGRRPLVFDLPINTAREITHAYYQILNLGNISELPEAEQDKILPF